MMGTDGNSKGSVGYAWGFEFFTKDDTIFRAPYENPLDTQGYRQGARFECFGNAALMPAFLRNQLSDAQGEPI